MRVFGHISSYIGSEDGAATVDVVVLMAACIAVAVSVVSTVKSGTLDFSTALADHIASLNAADAAGGGGAGSFGGTGTDNTSIGSGAGGASGGAGGGATPSGGAAPSTDSASSDTDPLLANPGNDTSVGGAGEDPTESGSDVWGSGSVGRSS